MSRFQTFDESTSPANGAERIKKLRAELARRGYDGYIVPRADEHQGEYVPPSAARLAWLTGFTGSAGTAVILQDKAALIVDGRYTVQAAAQVDPSVITPVQMADTPAELWVARNLPAGAVLAYDPWLHTPDNVRRFEKAAGQAGAKLVASDMNLVDVIWMDRPPLPQEPVRPHPLAFAGEAASDKLARIRRKMAEDKIDALVISDPHNLAWAFNLRGGDVACTPLPLGYAIIPNEGRAQLFFDPVKITNEAGDAVGDLAEFAPISTFQTVLDELGAKAGKVRVDTATGSVAILRRLEAAGGIVDVGADPIALMKAIKNDAEIRGSRAAHLRDGAAIARHLAWLDREAPTGRITEIDAVEKLEAFRIETGAIKNISFPTIAGAGPNAALPHYRVSTASNRLLELNQMFLVDSGAQYEDGTTDITRTVIVGEPTPEMKDRFTRVLKGHIAIATIVFPKGTSGAQINSFARKALWDAGLDFDHGTGHGIGSYLSVHEGPQRIAKTGAVPLEPGMMVSNEPGFYKEGDFGIRIENLILVEPRMIAGGDRRMLGFETLTFAPIDLRLVDVSLLTPPEVTWLDQYHASVREKLSALVDDETRKWLDQATRSVG